MSKYALGKRSLANLVGVHPDLVKVVKRAMEITTQDFTVTEGVRTPERQRELYAQGRTKPGNKVTWVLVSNHFKQADGFGHAVDMPPYPIDWSNSKENIARFDAVADAMRRASIELGINIRWGADWDQDGKPREKGESDSPHFELAKKGMK